MIPELEELISSLIRKINNLEKIVADLVTQEGTPGSYTDEEAQDAVGGILVDSATVDFTYADATPSITASVINDSITYAKMQNIATDSLVGRDTVGTGDPETIGLNATLSMDGAGNLQRAALTGDVTASAGSNTTAIGASKVLTAMIADAQVTLAKMANLAQATIIGRASGAGTGVPTALTAAQVVAIIQSSIDHGGIGGLSDDDHTQYALLAGRSGGQSLSGGTAANDDLTLQGTTNSTRTSSYVLIQPNGGNTAIGAVAAPLGVLHGVATNFTDTVLLERDGQTTDAFLASQRLLVTKTTNMGDGFGPGLAFAIQDDAAVINAIGVIGAIRSGADNTGEIVLAPLTAGVTNVRVTVKADGKTGFTTASPDSVIHTVGTNAQAGGWTLESSAGIDADRLAIYPAGNYSVISKLLSTNGTWRFQDSSGNVFAYMDTPTFCTVFGAAITPGASGALAVVAGASTNDAAVGGALYSTVTATGNVTTGEDTLATYTVPANTLSANNMSLRFEAWGTTANNANAKTIKVKFDGVIFGQRTMTTSAANTWVINGQVQRTGAATQTAFAKFVDGATTEVDSNVSLTSTLSNAIVFLITGEGTSTNDIILYGLRIWWEDANT